MSNTPILDLPVAIGLTGAEWVPVVQGTGSDAVTKRAQAALFDFSGGSGGSTEPANTGLFGPTSGAADVPTFRTLVSADLTGGSAGTDGYVLKTNGSIASWVETSTTLFGTSGYALIGNGASAATFQGFLQGGTGAVARTWQSKARERVTPQDFSSGTGLDSASIQLAINYVNSLGGGVVYCPKGTYILTSTLTMYAHVELIGDGFGATIFSRSTNYGDTLTIGTVGLTGGAQSVKVMGIWFLSTGSWTGNPIHLRLNHAQDAEIAWCWFWGLGGHVLVDGGTKVNIHDNEYGSSGAAGSFSVKIIEESSGAAVNVTTDISLNDNYFAASGYARAIHIEQVEVCNIVGGYIGGYITNSIYFDPQAVTPIISGVRISIPHLDPCSTAGRTIAFVYGDTYTTGVTIEGCNFYGGDGPINHIHAGFTGANWSVANLVISGNTFRDNNAASIKLLGAVGFLVSSNTFLNYNALHTSTVDPDYAAGIYILGGGASGVSRNGTVALNIFGATGSTIWTTAGDANNYCVWGVYTAGGVASANINLTGNEGVFRTGGAVVAGDITAQRTLTASTDNMVPRADGTTGNLQSSGVSIDDSNNVQTAGNYYIGGVARLSDTGPGSFTIISAPSGATQALSADATHNYYGNDQHIWRSAGLGTTFATLVSSAFTLGVQQTLRGQLVLANTAAGAFPVTVQSSNTTSAAWSLTLPTTAGTNLYFLQTNGSGVASWAPASGASISLTVGTTPITGGTTTRILYDNGGVLGEYSLTGSGTVAVMQNTPTLTTPVIGAATGTSAVLTNQIWSGSISSALSSLTGSTDGFRASAANVTQFAGENTTASSSTQGAFFGGYSNDGAAMASGDRLGGVRAGGSSSASAIRNAALIAAFADQAWVDASAYGTRWEFQTTTNSATSATTKLILGNAGVLSFGATAANTVPALKPSSTTLQVRLGDDSGFAPLSASALTLATALTVGNGGTGTSTTFTQGNVVFAGASGVYTQDNALFWDNTNKRLSVGGNTSPQTQFVVSNGTATGIEFVTNLHSTAAGAYFQVFDRTASTYRPFEYDASSHTWYFSGSAKIYMSAAGGFSVNTASDPGAGSIYTNAAAYVIRSAATYTDGAGAATLGAVTNAPGSGARGNPKWLPIDDNGTMRWVAAYTTTS